MSALSTAQAAAPSRILASSAAGEGVEQLGTGSEDWRHGEGTTGIVRATTLLSAHSLPCAAARKLTSAAWSTKCAFPAASTRFTSRGRTSKPSSGVWAGTPGNLHVGDLTEGNRSSPCVQMRECDDAGAGFLEPYPSFQPTPVPIITPTTLARPETGRWDTVFEACSAVCRTHSRSTVHENAYLYPRRFCFSGPLGESTGAGSVSRPRACASKPG